MAEGRIRMRAETLRLIRSGEAKKGDVIGVARLAAITDRQAAGLLPPADAAATYGSAMGGRNAGSVARIYRSAS